MTADSITILDSALALPEGQRAEIVVKLLDSLDSLPPSQRQSPEEWEAEVRRRIDATLDGDGKSIDLDEAQARIREAGGG